MDYGGYGYGSWSAFQSFTLNLPPPLAILGDPSGTLTSWDGSFHWTGVNGATWYRLEVQTISGSVLLAKWYSVDTACTGLSCSVIPEELAGLPDGDYQWQIQDYGPYGFGSTTAFQGFILNRE
jgi:hypothetical protein